VTGCGGAPPILRRVAVASWRAGRSRVNAFMLRPVALQLGDGDRRTQPGAATGDSPTRADPWSAGGCWQPHGGKFSPAKPQAEATAHLAVVPWSRNHHVVQPQAPPEPRIRGECPQARDRLSKPQLFTKQMVLGTASGGQEMTVASQFSHTVHQVDFLNRSRRAVPV
jgi:hypothetical protein